MKGNERSNAGDVVVVKRADAVVGEEVAMK